MPAPALHLGAVVTCSHAGPAQALSPFPRVMVSGQPIVNITSPYAITGCALTGTTTPPCATGQWTTGAVRVLAGGAPVTLMSGTSTCVPTGTPLLPMTAQTRVLVT